MKVFSITPVNYQQSNKNQNPHFSAFKLDLSTPVAKKVFFHNEDAKYLTLL